MLGALAMASAVLMTACGGPELPDTEAEAIAYVKSRLHPYENDPGVSERCRSFLKWASWSAYELSDDRWSVTGQVDADYLAGFYLSDNDALAEIFEGRGDGTWFIDPDEGNLVSISGLVGCDHR